MNYKSFNLGDWIGHINGVIEDESELDGDEMRDLVDFLTTLNQESSWIPVSERMPEIHQDVLLSLRSLDVEFGFRGNTEPYYYYCYSGYIEPQNVLAWQPKPEPYMAEGNKK